MSFEVFPDIEAVVATAIRSSGVCGDVHSSLPDSPVYPLVIVKRIGGIPAERHVLDAPSLQIEVWAEQKSDAHDVAQEARVVVFELEGQTLSDPVDAFISGVEDSLGLTWLPDVQSKKDRYIFGVRIYSAAIAAS